jgi:MoaA/NifB/PqqE/SkfB family radical SAM enzyme
MSRIERLAVELSYSCDQGCIFCSESDNIARYRSSPLKTWEIVRALVVMRRKKARIMFFAGGGEPTRHPKFLGLLRSAKRLGYKTFIITNGKSLADPVFASQALPMLDKVCLSVHGHTAKLHDRLTRTSGSFGRVMKAFSHIRGCPGTFLMTNTVVSRSNWDDIEGIVGFLADQKARICRLAQMAPEGRGALRYAEYAIRHEQWREKVPALIRLARRKGVRLMFDGLPMCALGTGRGLSADFERIPTMWLRRSSEMGGAQATEARLEEARYRFKAPVCSGCADTKICGGVFRLYVEAFGAEDLRPRRKKSSSAIA